jgi:Leucine-rich repeat (LRR) protein
LKTLPKNFGYLEQLEELEMFQNPSIEIFPKSFGQLKAFNHLELCGCLIGKGIGLASNFRNLTKLKSLSLDGNLMNTILESFKALNSLNWHGSPMLELPTNLNIFNLVKLNLGDNKNLKCLWECNPHTQVRSNQYIFS